MKYIIHEFNTNEKSDSFVKKIVSGFSSLTIPKHDNWKDGKKVVIQQLLIKSLTYKAEELKFKKNPFSNFHNLPIRVSRGLDTLSVRFGEDEQGDKFALIPCFNHSNGAERTLVFTNILYTLGIIHYSVLWVPSNALASITDGIVKESIFRECLTEYRGVFPQPTYLVEIFPEDFFDLKNYRFDTSFWKKGMKSNESFREFLKEEPGVKRYLGL